MIRDVLVLISMIRKISFLIIVCLVLLSTILHSSVIHENWNVSKKHDRGRRRIVNQSIYIKSHRIGVITSSIYRIIWRRNVVALIIVFTSHLRMILLEIIQTRVGLCHISTISLTQSLSIFCFKSLNCFM